MSLAKTTWCHYIFLCEQQVPDTALREALFLTPKLERWSEAGPERVAFDYMRSAIADLDWHGGITFYDLVCAVPGHRVLKAGCDYQHLWDEGQRYDEASVIFEVKRTIDSLWERWPNILVRDQQTGEWTAQAAEAARD